MQIRHPRYRKNLELVLNFLHLLQKLDTLKGFIKKWKSNIHLPNKEIDKASLFFFNISYNAEDVMQSFDSVFEVFP